MTDAPRIGLIWAQAEGGVIGRDGGMPWHVPEDLAHFKELTLGSPVVMGRGTWDSLAPRFRPAARPAQHRRHPAGRAGRRTARSGRARSKRRCELAAADRPEWIWIIGGGAIFARPIDGADRLEVTELAHPAGFAPTPDDVRAPDDRLRGVRRHGRRTVRRVRTRRAAASAIDSSATSAPRPPRLVGMARPH